MNLTRRSFLALAAAVSTAARGSSERPLGVAVVGHTGRGNYGHGLDTVWLKVPGLRVLAVSDPDEAGRNAALRRTGAARSFADHRPMFTAARPDLVAVCPRHVDQHAAIMLDAIAAGARGIYVEKPFVRTPAEADAIIAACRASGARVAVAHRNRHHPALAVAVNLARSGELGALREVRVRGKQDHRGGGLDLWVLGGHGFNLATCFTGPAVSCEAVVKQDGRPARRADTREGDEGVGPIVGDEINARFATTSGISLYFDSRKGRWDKTEGFGVRVIGERAMLDLRIDEEPLVHLVRAGVSTPVTSGGVGVPEPAADIRERVAGHLGAVRDLLAAMREGREPLCGAEAGRETVEMTLAVFASFAAGGSRVTLPLTNRAHPLA
ncbi:MAG: Gfo/Idh/MocA family protein [Opitutaceae bacterium]